MVFLSPRSSSPGTVPTTLKLILSSPCQPLSNRYCRWTLLVAVVVVFGRRRAVGRLERRELRGGPFVLLLIDPQSRDGRRRLLLGGELGARGHDPLFSSRGVGAKFAFAVSNTPLASLRAFRSSPRRRARPSPVPDPCAQSIGVDECVHGQHTSQKRAKLSARLAGCSRSRSHADDIGKRRKNRDTKQAQTQALINAGSDTFFGLWRIVSMSECLEK